MLADNYVKVHTNDIGIALPDLLESPELRYKIPQYIVANKRHTYDMPLWLAKVLKGLKLLIELNATKSITSNYSGDRCVKTEYPRSFFKQLEELHIHVIKKIYNDHSRQYAIESLAYMVDDKGMLDYIVDTILGDEVTVFNKVISFN